MTPLPRPTPRQAARLMLVATAAITAAPTLADDFPARKAGLWEIKVTADVGQPTQVMQQCIDAATDRALREHGQGISRQACSRHDMSRQGSEWVIDSVCKMGASTATSHAVITGDFSVAYRMRNQTTYSPPLRGRSAATMLMEARWLGACKPGQKPGDMVLPGGMTLNINRLPGGKRP